MTHICVSKLTIIGPNNGLSPGRCQAIIWTNVGILSIGPLGTNFSEILIWIETFSLKKMLLKLSSGKWRPFCLGLNVLIQSITCCCNNSCNFPIWSGDWNPIYKAKIIIYGYFNFPIPTISDKLPCPGASRDPQFSFTMENTTSSPHKQRPAKPTCFTYKDS